MNLNELNQSRINIGRACRNFISGEIDALWCTEIVLSSIDRARLSRADHNILPFLAVLSESDHLPKGEERCLWNEESLTALEKDVSRINIWAAEIIAAACRNLSQDFPENYDFAQEAKL